MAAITPDFRHPSPSSEVVAIDFARVQTLSTDAVQNEPQSLYANRPHLPQDNRRRIVEALVEKIVVGKDHLEITFSASGPLEDMTKNQQGTED